MVRIGPMGVILAVQDEKPWVLLKTDRGHAATIVAAALGVVKLDFQAVLGVANVHVDAVLL